jgi:hypothetical protein
MKLKTNQKFATKLSSRKIRVLSVTNPTYSEPYAVVVSLDKRNRRRPETTRIILVDSIRRKYNPV